MNKLGMHIHGVKPGIMQAIELLQPRTITMMDPTAQELHDVYAVANPVAVVRKYEDGKSFQQLDPRWWAEEYYRMVGDAVSDRLVALGINEPFGHEAKPLCAPFDEWNHAFIERCRELGPMDGGALAMATGNWTGAADRYRVTDDFPLTCGIAKYFLPHEYCWPTLEIGVPWYTLRYRAWIADLEATGKKDFFFIISESGLTQAVIAGRPDHGWRSGGPEGVTEDSYVSTIDWYNARLCEDWRVLGCCLYDYAGSHYGWETFEQLGLENRIFQIQAPEIPGPPEPPNGGEHMIPSRVQIFDFEHGPGDTETRDQAWLESIFGLCLNVHPITDIYTPAVGDVVYQLEWINCKPATVSVVTIVKDVYGEAAINEGVVFGWSTADPHGLENRGWNWTNNGAVGWTEPPDGHVGPAMSKDSYYSPDKGECGAHFLWIWGRPSPMIDGIGLLPFHDDVPGANHLHVEFGFRAVTWGGEPPVPPDTETLDEILHEVKVNQALLLEILAKPPVDPPPGPPPTDEFAVYFFNTVDLSGPVVAEMKDPKAFWHNWGEGSPAPGVNANYFSVKHEGTFRFEARPYTFNFFVDDGVKMWIDDILAFDAWKDQPPTSYSKVIEMTAGTHRIVLRYYEKAGGATFHFNWE